MGLTLYFIHIVLLVDHLSKVMVKINNQAKQYLKNINFINISFLCFYVKQRLKLIIRVVWLSKTYCTSKQKTISKVIFLLFLIPSYLNAYSFQPEQALNSLFKLCMYTWLSSNAGMEHKQENLHSKQPSEKFFVVSYVVWKA